MRPDIIEKLLKENTAVCGYKIRSERVESYELFFVHSKLETVRSTDTTSTDVTVYVDHDGKKGDASFKIYASTEEDEAREKIQAAAEKACRIDNEYYELPSNETLDGAIDSDFADYEPKTLARLISDAVFSANTYGNGSINALEVFINKHTVSVKNSRGIDKRELKYSAMVEAIPTWTDGESVELYEAKRFNSFDSDEIREEIEEKMREVRDRGRAVTPSEPLTCKVTLDAHELARLFSEAAHNANYSSVYTHSNLFSIGDTLQKEAKGDRISITMKGAIKGSVASALFDNDGVTLIDTEIVKDGVFTNYYGGNRYAQYLKAPVTGELSCIQVATGSLTDEKLKSEPYFRCVSMSGLQVDAYNDYIGGEVRLAYYCDGDKVIPMTGISISGKLSEALSSVRLSDCEICSGRYTGPKIALFEGIAIN